MAESLGFDLGGTKLGAAVIDAAGSVLWSATQHHRAEVPDIMDRIAAVVEGLRDSGRRFERIGLGVPGAVDDHGNIHLSPAIPGLADIDLTSRLQDRLGISVVVENDANAAALGEFRFGGHHRAAGEPVTDLACLCLGTGVGLGVVTGGHLLRGARGAAAEIADLRIDDGTGRVVRVEDVVAATALARAAGEDHRSAMPQVLEAFLHDEPAARAAVGRYCEVTARAVEAMCALVDPAVVVLSGGLGSQPVVAAEVTAAVHRLVPTVTVVRSRFGAAAPVVGAAALAVLSTEGYPATIATAGSAELVEAEV